MQFTHRHNGEERVLTELTEVEYVVLLSLEAILAAIDTLNQAVADNTTAVNNAVAHIGNINQDPAIQAAADQINANNTALNNAVTPPPPA